MGLYTLRFPDRPAAEAAAKALGFWRDPEPIYEDQPTGETYTRYAYVDADGGSHAFTYEPTPEEVEGLTLAEAETVPVMAPVQVSMTEGCLNTSGQSQDAETGEWFGWHIDEIGQDPIIAPGEYDEDGNEITPPVRASGFFVNVTGQLPPPAMAYTVAYGSGGRIFAGTTPEASP